MQALEQSKLFNELSSGEIAWLGKHAEVREYPAGHTIFKEGEEGDGIYVVVQGTVQITVLINETERRTLAELRAGDFFGEMAVLDNDPRSATATAAEWVQVVFISRDVLLKMLESSPRLAVSLVREFSRRMRVFNMRYGNEVLQVERFALVGRFARSVVHDFKNPLNVIGIAADMIALPTASDQMQRSACDRIRKQVDRLSNMISELLEFTRGEQSSVVFAETDYGSYLEQLLSDVRPELEQHSVAVECESPPPNVVLLVDPQRLTHVFYNLIHNSVDAMPAGGRILFRFHVNEKELVTEVEDTGKGIPEPMQARLFEAFQTHGKTQGTGLGLSICKKIIEDHNGRIEARNVPEGGALFSFSLPLAR